MFDDAPKVRAWLHRLTVGADSDGEFLADDEVPTTLDPIFELICEDQLAWVRTLLEAIDGWCADHPDATRVPRSLGKAAFEIRGVREERKLITFVQWKVQRARRALEGGGDSAAAWLARVSGSDDTDAVLPEVRHPMVLKQFKPVLERPPAQSR